MSSEPEYYICLNCETPTYVFEWREGRLIDIICATCGNDDPSEFMTETEMEEQR